MKEISNLPDKQFKVIFTNMLNNLRRTDKDKINRYKCRN